MERKPCYKLKDHRDFPNDIDVPFASQLRVELLCSTCNAITRAGVKDGEGHVFCQKCADTLTDSAGDFSCVICSWQGDQRSMAKNKDDWAFLEKTKAFCPNEKTRCSFTGTLKDVLRHYKGCEYTGKAPCSLCGCLLDKKAHRAHISHECPNRILQCVFCNADVEAFAKRAHEANCPMRPGTCQHCKQQFVTYAELEHQHYPKCPRMPVFCPFKDLGCKFEASRQEMARHEADSSHLAILVGALCRQQNEIKELKSTFEEEKKAVAKVHKEKIKELETKMADLQEEANTEFNHRVTLEKELTDLKRAFQAMETSHREEKGHLQERITEAELSVQRLDRELHLNALAPGFEYLWKLQPYSALKNAAIATTEEISSGVVYISKPGYAVEFMIGFVRPSQAVSTPQLSFKCRIHGGSYDDMLPWPFKNKIILFLINQHNEADSRSFELNPAEAPNADELFKKPEPNQPNSKFGFSQVISIPLMENGRKGFLFHNCVIFKVVVPPLL